MESPNDPGNEPPDQHTRQQPPVTRGGLAGSADEDVSGGISMSGVGEPPEDKDQDALDQIVEGGARLGWGGTSNPTPGAAEARDRALADVEDGEDG